MTSGLLIAALLASPGQLKDCPGPSAVTAAELPAKIAAPAGSDLFLRLYAVGAQIYTCSAQAWTLKGPDARLYDASCKQVGTHFTGPSWKLDADGSQVTGKKMADAPGTSGVAWLLLSTTSSGKPGALASTKFIQRVSTSGGAPPSEPCDATTLNKEKASPYTATYLFYRAH